MDQMIKTRGLFIHFKSPLLIQIFQSSSSSSPLLFVFSSSCCRIDMASLKSWVSEHKLATIGTVWASSIAASLAYNRNKYPIKGGIRLIHSRLHAQALTLAVLSGIAIKHYYFDAKDEGDMYPPEWSNVPEGEDRWSW